MEFVSLGAMVVTLRGVVVGDFPIQIAKMKTQVFQGYKINGHYIISGSEMPSDLEETACVM